MGLKKIIFIKIVSGVLFFIICLYFGIAFLHWGRFPVGSRLDGYSIAFKSISEMDLSLMQGTARKKFKLYLRDGSELDLLFKDIGVYRECDSMFRGMSFDAFLWPKYLFQEKLDYSTQDVYFYDRERLGAYLSGICGEPEANSGVVISDDGEVMQESGFVGIDPDKLLDAVCQCLDESVAALDLEASGCYAVPKGSLDDCETEFISISEAMDRSVVIQMGCGVTEELPAGILEKAFYLKDSQVWMKPSVFRAYADHLAQKYDSYGKARTFVDSSGKAHVLQPKESDTFYGYLLDSESLGYAISQAVLSGSGSAGCTWQCEGKDLLQESGSDIGDRYVEVSIQDQHLWFYQDGELVLETDVVTGKEGMDTPAGVYSVQHMFTDYLMHYPEGQSRCQWFARLTPDGVGVHDASWRSAFGGEIWHQNGSHGCINVPVDVMQELQGYLSDGTPVVVY